MRWRILSELILASCVGYFDLRVLRGTKFDNSDNILRNLLAVELRGVNIYGVLPGGVAGGQQISSPCLTLGFARLT